MKARLSPTVNINFNILCVPGTSGGKSALTVGGCGEFLRNHFSLGEAFPEREPLRLLTRITVTSPQLWSL